MGTLISQGDPSGKNLSPSLHVACMWNGLIEMEVLLRPCLFIPSSPVRSLSGPMDVPDCGHVFSPSCPLTPALCSLCPPCLLSAAPHSEKAPLISPKHSFHLCLIAPFEIVHITESRLSSKNVFFTIIFSIHVPPSGSLPYSWSYPKSQPQIQAF